MPFYVFTKQLLKIKHLKNNDNSRCIPFLSRLFFGSLAFLFITFASSTFIYSFFDGNFPINTDSLTFSSIPKPCDLLWHTIIGKYATNFSGNFWTFNVALPTCIQSIKPIVFFNSIILLAGIYTVLFLGYIRNEIRKSSILVFLIICANPFILGRYFEYSRELVMITMLLIYSMLFNSSSSLSRKLKYFSLTIAVAMRPVTMPLIVLSHFNLICIQDIFKGGSKNQSSFKRNKYKFSHFFLILEFSLVTALVINRQQFLKSIPIMQTKIQNNFLFSTLDSLSVLKYNMFGSFGELVSLNKIYSFSTIDYYYIMCAIWLSSLIICLTIVARVRYILFILLASLLLTLSYPTPHARYMIPFNIMAISFVYPKNNSSNSDLTIEPGLCDESK